MRRTMRPTLIACTAALLGSAVFTTAAESTTATTTDAAAATETPAQEQPASFAAGDAFPIAALPTTWLRGEPIRTMEPGITYVITRWNTRGPGAAPGYNLTKTLAEIGPQPRLQPLVIFAGDDIPREKLERLLAYPSHRNALPLADATVADNLTSRLWLPRMAKSDLNTVVVRDARVVWAGNGHDLGPETLTPFLTEDFDYEKYTAEKAVRDARIQVLATLILKDYATALREGNTERADAILAELKAEPNLHPFIGMRLYDALFQRALTAGDIPGALAAMHAMVDAYPDEKGVQSWAHKVINSSEPVLAPGQAQAGRAAARVAELRNDAASIQWWRAAASHFLNAGDKPAALAALESAERSSETYKKLQTYLAAEKTQKGTQ